MKSLLYKHVI